MNYDTDQVNGIQVGWDVVRVNPDGSTQRLHTTGSRLHAERLKLAYEPAQGVTYKIVRYS